MNKKNNTKQDHAVGFDYPNDVKPIAPNNIYYGTISVPCGTSCKEAKIASHKKVMEAVLEAK